MQIDGGAHGWNIISRVHFKKSSRYASFAQISRKENIGLTIRRSTNYIIQRDVYIITRESLFRVLRIRRTRRVCNECTYLVVAPRRSVCIRYYFLHCNYNQVINVDYHIIVDHVISTNRPFYDL